MNRIKLWLLWINSRTKQALQYLNSHKTKVLGLAAAGVAYVQNNLAQAGHLLSPKLQGAILAVFGVAAFVIGLVNTFTNRDPPSA
jgi:protein involved in ribonucleotide reduction